MPESILLIEDDPHIAALVKLHLNEAGALVNIFSDGLKAFEEFSKHQYSLLIIDLMLPGLEGKEIIKRVRASDTQIPILITTAKSDLMHKIVGFELGADDYLSKPFEIAELVVRVKALLRRGSPQAKAASEVPPTEIGNIKVDQYKHKVFINGKEVSLSPKLFDLLIFLMKSPGRAYTRTDLLTHVWGYDHEGYEHTVDTHINRLRSKIEPNPANPTYIITVWGIGYRFAELSEIK